MAFRSSTAGVKETFVLCGLASVLEEASAVRLRRVCMALPADSTLARERAFSVHDFNYSAGRRTTADAGLTVGYSLVYVATFKFDGALFSSQSCHGSGSASARAQ
jgi:hypothetical protein